MSILVVIADGVFSHAYADQDVYIVDLDDKAEDKAIGAVYFPETDYREGVPVEEINKIFDVEFELDQHTIE